MGQLQLEQVLLPVRPGQGLGDLRLAGLAALVPVLGQLLRRPRPPQDRPEDGPPGDARDVAEDFRQLQVHLLQGLLHVLHVPAGRADQVGPLSQVGA